MKKLPAAVAPKSPRTLTESKLAQITAGELKSPRDPQSGQTG